MNVERIQQEQLNEIANMPRGWDSYDALPINKRAILEARRIVSFMPGYWTIVPRSDGSLQLERHAGGLDIECVISGESPTPETRPVPDDRWIKHSEETCAKCEGRGWIPACDGPHGHEEPCECSTANR